jgi:hypothetical protein
MRVLEPKNRRAEPVKWKISEHSREIVKQFAAYCEYSEEEVVDQCIKILLQDEDFLDWIESRRYNKTAIAKIFPDGMPDRKGKISNA